MDKDKIIKKELLRKGKKGLFRVLFSRFGLMCILIVLQLALIVSLFRWFRAESPIYYLLTVCFTFCVALWLFNCRIDPSAKITWLALIAVFPIGGAALLFYTRRDVGHRVHKQKLKMLIESGSDKLSDNEDVRAEIADFDRGAAMLSDYLMKVGSLPPYRCEFVRYFSSGREKWLCLLEELKKAEKFIFLEYFIIEEGLAWGEVLKVLADKAAEGVDVRVLYDGTCEFSLLPHNYPGKLKKLGINARVFAPLTPFISTYYNYRDHRKIAVIDGATAFTGGVNLADEYIGAIERFGVWKDAAVMFRGDAVRTFTLSFLEMWHEADKETEFDKFINYSPSYYKPCGNKGFIIPYADNPLDDYKLGEMVYIDILNRSADYVHIMTPYLILDGELETALKFAAERGVDISIILPGIPDKRVPYALAWTHYKSLLDAGVKVYEFTPGFVHAKVFVSDDREAVVGTINLDYRSLYHHFECAVYMLETDNINDIKKDFLATLSECRTVTYDTINKTNLFRKATGYVMKLVAPLL